MPRTLLSFLLSMLVVVACTSPTQPEPTPVPTAVETPVRTQVTNLDAFNAWVATRPTPDALRQRYPGLLVVMPGDITTRELRSDDSRFFAEIDAEGRVAGGRFQ